MFPDYGETPDLLAQRSALRARMSMGKAIINAVSSRSRLIADAYEALFYRDGVLKPEARIVLDDLSDEAGLGKAAAGLEHEELCALEGKRRLMLHILGRFRQAGLGADTHENQMRKER